MLAISRSRDMGIPIPGKDGLYIETGPIGLLQYRICVTYQLKLESCEIPLVHNTFSDPIDPTLNQVNVKNNKCELWFKEA